MRVRHSLWLPVALAMAMLPSLTGCGGQSRYTQEQHYDLVDCSMAGWGSGSMPRQMCLDQGGLPL